MFGQYLLCSDQRWALTVNPPEEKRREKKNKHSTFRHSANAKSGALHQAAQQAHLKVSHHSPLWMLLCDKLPHHYTVAEDVHSVITPALVHR